MFKHQLDPSYKCRINPRHSGECRNPGNPAVYWMPDNGFAASGMTSEHSFFLALLASLAVNNYLSLAPLAV